MEALALNTNKQSNAGACVAGMPHARLARNKPLHHRSGSICKHGDGAPKIVTRDDAVATVR
jgi:hypothetical protein